MSIRGNSATRFKSSTTHRRVFSFTSPLAMDSAQSEALRKIIFAAQRTKSLVSSRLNGQGSKPLPKVSPPPAIPSLQLPYPHDLSFLLQNKSLPKNTKDALLSKIYDCISHFQRLHTQKFESTCNRLLSESGGEDSSSFLTRLASEYEESYKSCYISWLRRLLQEKLSSFPNIDSGGKPSFNTVCQSKIEAGILTHTTF